MILLFEADENSIKCLVDILLAYERLLLASGENGCLVENVLQIGPRHADSLSRYFLKIYIGRERLVPTVDVEDAEATILVG